LCLVWCGEDEYEGVKYDAYVELAAMRMRTAPLSSVHIPERTSTRPSKTTHALSAVQKGRVLTRVSKTIHMFSLVQWYEDVKDDACVEFAVRTTASSLTLYVVGIYEKY
jgi:hypothetical protein